MANPVAIVTGANRALGLATARALAQRGLRVLLAVRRVMVSSGMGQLAELPARLRRLAEEIADRAGVARFASELVRLAAAGERVRSYALAYAASKAALNAATRLLAAELAPRGVLVNAVCPGWVPTDMGGAGAPRSLDDGATSIVWAATLPPGGPSGGFFRDGEPIPW